MTQPDEVIPVIVFSEEEADPMAFNPAALPNPAEVAQEQHDIFKLKLDGLTVREIANQLGMAKSTVQNRLQDAYEDLVVPLAKEAVQVELARLDRWQLRLEQRMEAGEPAEKIVPVSVKVAESRRKLLGTDAAVKVDATVHEVTQHDLEIQDLISQAKAKNAARREALS